MDVATLGASSPLLEQAADITSGLFLVADSPKALLRQLMVGNSHVFWKKGHLSDPCVVPSLFAISVCAASLRIGGLPCRVYMSQQTGGSGLGGIVFC